MNEKKHNSFNQSEFLNSAFCFLIALNRGALSDISDRKQTMENSMHRLCRLLQYSSSPNKYSRVDYELSFTDYYLQQQSLRLQEKLEYKIETDNQAINKSIPRLELFYLLEDVIDKYLGKSSEKFTIEINAKNLNIKKNICITIHQGNSFKEYHLRICKMKEFNSNYYMLPPRFTPRSKSYVNIDEL